MRDRDKFFSRTDCSICHPLLMTGGIHVGYNWDGDLILHDSAIENKRYIIGLRQPITTDIREWISFGDNIIMKDILRDLRKNHRLPATKNPGDFDRRAVVVWRFVARRIRYIHDTTEYKKGDFWLFPPETFQVGKGDCEDSSFLLASLLIASGISPFCVRVVLGRAHDRTNRPLGGHCWPIYKNEQGRWCVLESTLDHVPLRMPEADALVSAGRPFRYEPLYCFNAHHLWEILPEESTTADGRSLNTYFAARKKRVNMREVLLHDGRQRHLKDSAMQQDLILNHVNADARVNEFKKKTGRPHEMTIRSCRQSLSVCRK